MNKPTLASRVSAPTGKHRDVVSVHTATLNGLRRMQVAVTGVGSSGAGCASAMMWLVRRDVAPPVVVLLLIPELVLLP